MDRRAKRRLFGLASPVPLSAPPAVAPLSPVEREVIDYSDREQWMAQAE